MNKITVPGKLMLAGEYAVLFGEPALAMTTDRTLNLTLTPASLDGGVDIVVTTSLWAGDHRFSDHTGQSHDPVWGTLSRAMRIFGYPLESLRIDIQSTLGTCGLGSSSGLRLGLLQLFAQYHGQAIDDPRWEQEAIELQCQAQPCASGYDVMTQSRSGLIRFDPESDIAQQKKPTRRRLRATPLKPRTEIDPFLHLYVSTTDAPTAETMAPTLSLLEEDEHRRREFCRHSTTLVNAWTNFLCDSSPDASLVYRATGAFRKCLAKTPSYPEELTTLDRVPGCDHRWSFKTTGAGGRDVLMLTGSEEAIAPPGHYLESVGWRPLAEESML